MGTRIRLHIENRGHSKKPPERGIAQIRRSFLDHATIQELTLEEIMQALEDGRTIEPGVCPAPDPLPEDQKGTKSDDFQCQQLFLIDIDNKTPEVPLETPEHVSQVLRDHGIIPVFMYETFSSKPDQIRFRAAFLLDEPVTNKDDRDRAMQGLLSLFPQADHGCTSAAQMFLGTNKAMMDDIGDPDGATAKEAFLALMPPEQPEKRHKRKRAPAEAGNRNNDLMAAGNAYLLRYGDPDGVSREKFDEWAGRQQPPLEKRERESVWKSCLKHYRKIQEDPDYVPPRDFPANLRPKHHTDVDQAMIFRYRESLSCRFSKGTGWIVYDGRRWLESDLKARAKAQELTDIQLKDAEQLISSANAALVTAVKSGDKEGEETAKEDEKRAQRYLKYVVGRRRSGAITACLKEAEPMLQIGVDQLDGDPYILCTPAGTVDLRTGEMYECSPTDFCTKITAVSPGTEGREIFQDFLDQLTCGDKELEKYLQQLAGACLTGRVFQEKVFIAYGSGGNGKSTFFNLLSLVLGDYAGTIDPDVLLTKCKETKKHEMADLRGKRLVVAGETEEGCRLDLATVKRISSTDKIRGERKYKDAFDFWPSHTLILYTNHLPKVGSIDQGSWDRLEIIPFNGRFRSTKGEVLNYAEVLFHQCGGSVLSWMIEGAKILISNGGFISRPRAVAAAYDEYKNNNDWLGNFLSEYCETGTGFREKRQDVYRVYCMWCGEQGPDEYQRNNKDFCAAMELHGFKTITIHGIRSYNGVRLKHPKASNDGRFEKYK